MTRATPFACAVLFAACAFAQAPDETAKPWDVWQPPEVVMPDPNAFDLYLEAFRLLEQLGEPDLINADRDTLAKQVESHSLTLRLLQEALMGECRLPVVTGAEQVFPYLARFRSAARLLTASARLYREDGFYLEAALEAIDGLRMAHDVATQRILIGELVGVACAAISLKSLEETIPFLSAEDCRIAINVLRQAETRRIPFAEIVEGELVYGKRSFRDQIMASFPPEVPKLLEGLELPPGSFVPSKSWEALERVADFYVEQATQPWRPHAEPPDIEDPLAGLLVPVFSRTRLKAVDSEADVKLAILHLACRAYWLEEDAPPEDLDALVPEYLPAIPSDPFSGKPFLCARGDKALLLYSVGPDGVDDWGLDIAGWVTEDSTGDIVVALTEQNMH